VTDFIDLNFRGSPQVIAAAIVPGRDGLTLIDPGPTSCLATLESGLATRGHRLRDVRTILLTHIHLDHAGATGTIVERVPHVKVYVHERGAPHMIDPARLLASSARLHGDQMDTLWGAFVAVPAANVTALSGGERLDVGGTALKVAYTPGHAKHHVSFLDEHTGVAYVGDTGGVRVGGEYVIAPTPPPDIDVEVWNASLDTIAAWQPVSLFITHFGEVTPSKAHLARVRDELARSAQFVKAGLEAPGSDESRMQAYADFVRRDIRKTLSEQEARVAELAAPFDQLWQGLARYWSKKATPPAQ
jgi:glyoxylase-like metal-dependent hydrolase (beta-lactamase superfamily II)